MKIVNKLSGLPEFFDEKEQKKKWMDTENCQLCDSKFTFMKRKHNCRRCGRCLCDKCSKNERALSRHSIKKHRVCDRCDFKLENIEFENTYKGILKAEDEVSLIQKNISTTLSKEMNKKINITENDDELIKTNKEMEEKIKNLYEDLKYINKSKNLMTKNVKNAEQHIGSLNDALEDLRTQKYLLTKNKNDILVKGQYYEEKLSTLNPDFNKFIQELNKTNFEDDEELDLEQLRNSRSFISSQAINEVREQIRKGEVDLSSTPFPTFQQDNRPKRVFDREEDKKRVEKLEKLQKQQEDTVIEERESEYFGSCLSAQHLALNKLSNNAQNHNQINGENTPNFKKSYSTAKFEEENNSSPKSGKNKKKDKNEKCVIF